MMRVGCLRSLGRDVRREDGRLGASLSLLPSTASVPQGGVQSAVVVLGGIVTVVWSVGGGSKRFRM